MRQPKQIKQIYTSIRRGVAKHKFLEALFVVRLPFVRISDRHYSTHDCCFFLWPFQAEILSAHETAENYLQKYIRFLMSQS